MKKNLSNKTYIKVLIMLYTLVFTFFSVLGCYSGVLAVEKAPSINIGQKNIAVKIKYKKGTQTVAETLISNNDGIVFLDNLYSYCKELNWDEHEPFTDPEGPITKEIKIEYEINYPGKTPVQKDNEQNGDGHYTDAQGDYIIKYGDDWQAEKEIKIKEIKYVEGKAVYLKNDSSTSPCQHKTVKIGNKTLETDNEGVFSGYPDMKETDYMDKDIFIEGNDYYNDYQSTYSSFADTHVAELTEKDNPSKTDYLYGNNISDNGYVARPGTYIINGTNGSTLSLNENGPFSASVNVSIDESGNVPDVYVKRSDGEVTKPIKNIIHLDQTVPVIDGVDVVKETEGDEINFLKYGLFTKTFADLTIEMRVSDTGAGIDNIYMEGTNKTTGEKKIYKPVKMKKSNNTYNLAFEIEGDDFKILESVLKVMAIDKVGNISELRLVRASEAASTIMFESIKPVISDINVKGNISSNGWYNGPVSVDFDVQDKNSGLFNLRINVNGKDAYVKEFSDTKNNKKNHITLDITPEMIKSLINATGSYEAFCVLTDNSGNVTTLNKKVNIDIVEPNISLSGIKNNGNYNKTPTLKIQNDEKHYAVKGAYISLKVLKDGRLYYEKKYEHQNEVKFDGFRDNGKYKISVFAVDAAGNKSDVENITFIKDTVKPLFKITKISGKKKNNWYRSEVKVNFSAYDAISGLSDINVNVNDKEKFSRGFSSGIRENKNYAFTITEKDVRSLINDAGSYDISMAASDKANNISRLKRKIKIDLVSPVVTLSGVKEGKHYRSAPSLKVKNNEKHYKEKGARINITVYRDGKKADTKNFNEQNNAEYGDFNKDGNYRVQVYAIDAAGNKSVIRNIRFIKDSTSPKITINGVSSSKIYNTNKTVSVSINERYYKTNKVRISVLRKLNGRSEKISFPWSNDGKNSLHSKMFSQTGTYTIHVNTVDKAGNKAVSKSVTFTIDNQTPKITITNIRKKAYGKKDVVAPIVSVYDDFYKSSIITLTKNGSKVKMPYSHSSGSKSEKVAYNDFAKNEKNDGVYKLTIKASDKAGNYTMKTITFSVNRFGSTFNYNKTLLSIIAEKYIKRVPNDLMITEYNVTKVNKSIDDIKRDGISSNIKSKISEKKESNYRTYTHKYTAFDFNKEGIYTINVISKDDLNNIAESKKKAGKINFAVDRTPPNIILNKEISNKAFDANIIIVKGKVIDSVSPASVSVKVNDEVVAEKKFKKNAGNVEFKIPEGRNNNVVITTKDIAGNKKEFKYRNVTVSTNWFTRLTSNRLFYAGIAIFLIAAAASAFLVYKKKKTAQS